MCGSGRRGMPGATAAPDLPHVPSTPCGQRARTGLEVIWHCVVGWALPTAGHHGDDQTSEALKRQGQLKRKTTQSPGNPHPTHHGRITEIKPDADRMALQIRKHTNDHPMAASYTGTIRQWVGRQESLLGL